MSLARTCRLLSRTLCLGTVPMVVFAFWDPFFNPLTVKELFIEACGLLVFLAWWVSGGPSRGLLIPNPLSRPLFYMCFFALLSILWTPARQIALVHWVAFFSLLAFFPPCFDFGKAAHFRMAYRHTLILIATVLLILSAFQINGVSLDGLMRTTGGNPRTRLSLTIGHNNGVAPIILLTSFLGLSALVRCRWLVLKLGYIGFIAASWILIVFFLLTRSTILGLLAGGFLLLVFNLLPALSKATQGWSRKRVLITRLALSGGFVVIVAVLLIGVFTATRGGAIQGEYNPNLAHNIADRLRTFNPEFLMRDTRARLWTISLHMMKHHPLVGTGFSSVKIDYPFYQAVFFETFPDFPAGPTMNHTEGMHNDYIQWGVETGAIGLVLLIWMLLVFFKSGYRWYRTLKDKPAGARFSESALAVAILALLMDAFFSFPAHIAPIAVYLPGLAMLWFAIIYPAGRQKFNLESIQPKQAGIRLAIAACAWGVLVVPLGTGTEKIPVIAQTGIWSPISAQVIGATWHSRLSGVRVEFRNQLNAMRDRLLGGVYVTPDELSTTLEQARRFLEKNLQVARLIPFAGDALYDMAGGYYDVYRFLRATRDKALQLIEQSGKGTETISRVYTRTGDVLLQTENLYQQALRNYRYHSLYWLLGLAQIDRASLPGIPGEIADELRRTGLENLAIGRRIFKNDERVLAEVDVALSLKEDENANQRIAELMALSPALVRNKAIPALGARKVIQNPETNKVALDPSAEKFFQGLLPNLKPFHLPIIRDALPVLDRGQAIGLAREYAELEAQYTRQPLGAPFWRMRLIDHPKTPEDVARLMEEYRSLLGEHSHLPPIQRVLFLSDIQRFAPAGSDLSDWRTAVTELSRENSGTMTQVLCRQMLAQEDLYHGDYLAAWTENLESHALTTEALYPSVAGRRSGVIDMSLWGITWPLISN